MAKYQTRKTTTQAKARTVANRTARAVKYNGAARVTTAGRAR